MSCFIKIKLNQAEFYLLAPSVPPLQPDTISAASCCPAAPQASTSAAAGAGSAVTCPCGECRAGLELRVEGASSRLHACCSQAEEAWSPDQVRPAHSVRWTGPEAEGQPGCSSAHASCLAGTFRCSACHACCPLQALRLRPRCSRGDNEGACCDSRLSGETQQLAVTADATHQCSVCTLVAPAPASDCVRLHL